MTFRQQLPPFRREMLLLFPGWLAALAPGVVWRALAQGSGELIWWLCISAVAWWWLSRSVGEVTVLGSTKQLMRLSPEDLVLKVCGYPIRCERLKTLETREGLV